MDYGLTTRHEPKSLHHVTKVHYSWHPKQPGGATLSLRQVDQRNPLDMLKRTGGTTTMKRRSEEHDLGQALRRPEAALLGCRWWGTRSSKVPHDTSLSVKHSDRSTQKWLPSDTLPRQKYQWLKGLPYTSGLQLQGHHRGSRRPDDDSWSIYDCWGLADGMMRLDYRSRTPHTTGGGVGDSEMTSSQAREEINEPTWATRISTTCSSRLSRDGGALERQ
jgi:hypothetical protein